MDSNLPPSRPMIEKVMKVSGYGARLDKLLHEYPLFIAGPYLLDKESSKNIIDQLVKPEQLMANFQSIYSKHFTSDEILDLIAFYKTPTGKKFVEQDEALRLELQDQTIKAALEIAIEMVRKGIKGPDINPDSPFNPEDSY